jgi:hypothetical protein
MIKKRWETEERKRETKLRKGNGRMKKRRKSEEKKK